ncbi:hypothetical protein CI109_101725 [Kwoniella shandongensis]|uniref:Uncharacterized protein n=1 Tax=Kwoniella shandongensis TaxID=1734106 RepID=A0A5M6C6B6_9TREE|nr:uncharacterized protein CI109_001152 [Kwoniella shandongensis]KAA5530351.1 hypothetical protein CI109_001152 [Kwoniella shandongensis]
MAHLSEATRPLLSDFDEKIVGLAQNELPPPSTATASTPRRRFGVAKGLILFSLLAFLAVNSIKSLATSQRSGRIASFYDDTTEVGGYWRSVATEGMRFALPSSSVETAGLVGEREHGHKRLPGHHSIPPKVAEKIFLDVPNNNSVAAASQRYTSTAHIAGSGWDFVSAINLKNEWERELGLRISGPEEHLYEAGSRESQSRIKGGMDKIGVWVDTYFPVMNTPVHVAVTLLTDPPFHAKLKEDIVDGDKDSILRDEVPVFHGLSVSGDVTAKYIYAGYGRKQDFDLLEEKGVDIKDKIALVKYGGCFRGLKIKAAQEAGASGVIIFTDPGDDGEITVENGYEAYPEGPARQPSSVQRGSVQFLSKYPGDPTTPGEPAYKNATRLEGGNQPSIPSLPMSYEDVIPLLKALKGKGIHASDLGDDWVGGLGYHGVDYFVGPSDVDLHLVNEVNTRVMPIWNTFAVIPGHITDEVVIFGNHRDAWVLGAADPSSGTASQYEVVRGLGALLKKGWKPLRTIVLASWDAEEYGLIGSTEWAEDFGSWLQENAVAYLNLDGSASGTKFHASASPSLAHLIKEAAEQVESSLDPTQSVWSTHSEAGIASALSEDYDIWAEAKDTVVSPLGSGSDFTPFLQRYGIASSDLGYGGGANDAVYHYHSIYDSHTWQKKYGDVGFHRHTDGAKVVGLTLLRLADSIVLPLNTTQYAQELGFYVKEVERIAKDSKLEAEIHLSSLSAAIESVKTASSDLDAQRHAALAKLRELLPKPHQDRASLLGRVNHLCGGGASHETKPLAQMQQWEDQVDQSSLRDLPRVPELPHLPRLPNPDHVKDIKAVLKEIRAINKKLQHFESGFLSEKGLKDREWYKHKGTAPGLWLGYGATTFPGLTEALTIDHDPALAQKEADELTDLISAIAKRLAA